VVNISQLCDNALASIPEQASAPTEAAAPVPVPSAAAVPED